jgi:PAS domain S-box-containing protein
MDMIIAVDRDRRIIEFNRAAEETFGYSRGEVLGKDVGILYADPERGVTINRVTGETGGFSGEIINKRKNGETFPSFISASVLRDADSQFMGFMGISRDITELKRRERMLLESEKMASLGRLIAGAAHELNNPINFIYSNISHLRRYIRDIKAALNEYRDICVSTTLGTADRVAAVQRLENRMDLSYILSDLDNLVDDIKEGAVRTKGIVEDLKAFSRSDEGRIADIDINEDIEKTLNLLADYHRGRITINRDYADLPEVKCYQGQISQVFMNLIANACQAIAGEGDIWIRTRLEDKYVIVSIRDNGAGIPGEHIDKIFDPFFTTRDVGKGTGLGLTTSYGIIQRHKGEILVDSEEGSGTTFTVRIPVDFESQ